MCIIWADDVIIDCEFCGDPINISRGEHTFRTPHGSVVCLDCRYPRECEVCGERCETITPVDDCDPSVGYRNTIDVGECCIRRRA